MEERIKRVESKVEKSGEEPAQNGGSQTEELRYKCIVLTDSNGRDATADSIRNHMPVNERGKYDIRVEVAYRVEDAIDRISSGELDVAGCYVVADNLTNNVRGGRRNQVDTPQQLIQRIDGLRKSLFAAGAAAVVITEIKPMRMNDVRPYNRELHNYLRNCGTSGFGCKTQIRMEYLRADGFHVNPMYCGVVDRGYACALLGIDVPCPTPDDNFIPDYLRRRMDRDWPRLVGAGMGWGT